MSKPLASRLIWHLDLDCFFVSAERLGNPRLNGRPVAVGGDGPRGVIASCSYEARKFGVRSAQPTARALKLCPSLILAPPTRGLYSRLSKQVFEIVSRFTPVWEATGIDEGYLDMTGSSQLFGPALEAGARLRATIKSETGLSCSIGMAPNRLVAKIATDFCKPDNMHLVEPGTEAAFLAPLSIDRLPGCGPKTAQWLRDREVKILRELQRYPLDVLEKRLGRFGRYLHDSAWGRGSTAFHEEARSRSISRETTFSDDEADARELEKTLFSFCAELASELRESSDWARAIRLKLRYPPFETVTRTRVLPRATQSDTELHKAAVALFRETWDPNQPVRLIGTGCVIASADDHVRQLDLFDDHDQTRRTEKLDALRDSIRARFGARGLSTGRDIEE